MRRGLILDIATTTVIAAFAASPAWAGNPVLPAPVAGVGIGAFVLMGLGYRALKRRIDK